MLLILTLVTVALVVLALVVYLSWTALALDRARRNVAAIADGLEAVKGNTQPLAAGLGEINAGMVAVSRGLSRADGHLCDAATVFGLKS